MRSNEERPRLGSLAQSARKKHLNQVRGILIVLGASFIGLCGILNLVTLDEQIEKRVKEEQAKLGPGQFIDQAKVEEGKRIVTIVCYGFIGLGVLYLLFAALVHSYPVPVTVLALVLYVGVHVTLGVMAPQSLLHLWYVRLIFLIILIAAVKTGVAYEKERRLEEEQEDEEHEDESEAKLVDEVEPADEDDDRDRRRRYR